MIGSPTIDSETSIRKYIGNLLINNYITIFTSAGGPGNSKESVVPTLFPPTPITSETHTKNFLNDVASIVSSVNTWSVSFFSGSIFALGPAAQAIILAKFLFFYFGDDILINLNVGRLAIC